MTESLTTIESSVAVSLAMEEAVYALTKEIDDLKDEKQLSKATGGQCYNACLESLSYLFNNHLDQFNVLCLLRHEKVQTHAERPIGEFHEYFLVRDNKGTWFSASPANHTIGSKEDSRLKRYFRSKDLGEILERIEEFEGGNWPSKELVEQGLRKKPSPSVSFNVDVFVSEFVNDTNGDEFETFASL